MSEQKKKITHIIEESLLGVFPILLVQHLLKNAHPRRHQQSKGQHANTWTEINDNQFMTNILFRLAASLSLTEHLGVLHFKKQIMTDYFRIFYRPGLDGNGCQDTHWQAFWEIGNQSLVSINGNHFLTYKNTRTANSKMCPPLKINTFFLLKPKICALVPLLAFTQASVLRDYGKANEVVWLWCAKVTHYRSRQHCIIMCKLIQPTKNQMNLNENLKVNLWSLGRRFLSSLQQSM